MFLHIFWEIVKYSDYPTFSGLFPNKKCISKFNYLISEPSRTEVNTKGRKMEIVVRKIVREDNLKQELVHSYPQGQF